MAINLYTGTPGSGKSLDLARDIIRRLRRGSRVIANIDIDVDEIKGNKGTFVYLPDHEMTPQFLYDFARLNHERGKEGQTLIIIDECQLKFNPRDYLIKSKQAERMEWIEFFTTHRHYGYNVILSTQWDRMIDRQIRALVEYEYIHRKINNYKIFALLPFKLFVSVQYWYGLRLRIGAEFYIYRKLYSRIYDSYTRFSDENIDPEELRELQEKIERKYKRAKPKQKRNARRDGGIPRGGLSLRALFKKQ